MKKTGWFALFVVLLLGGTYYFEFYKTAKEEQQKSEEAKIVAFPSDQIHQVEIENKSGKALLKRDADGWKLEQPVQDWADNQFTEDFIKGLAEEKSIETATEGTAINWSLYGLDKDVSRVVFTNQQGKALAVTVSGKKNFEGNAFLRRGDENKVLVGSSQWIVRSQKAPLEFRDKRFFRGKIGAVEKIAVKSEKDEFELVNTDNKWLSRKSPDLKLDQNKVREILTSLNEARALDFLEKLPPSTVKAKILLKLKDKEWSAEIRQGKDKDKSYYALVSEPAFILKMDPGSMGRFTEMTLGSLRDHKEAFDFPNLQVREIEIHSKLKKTSLVKVKDEWKLKGDDKAKIDQEAVRNFIFHLSDSAVTEYLDKSEAGAMKGADNQILLKDEKQKTLFELSWGPEIKKKGPTGERTLVLAQSNLFKDVFGLDPSVIDSWGLLNLRVADQNKENQKKDHP